MPQRVSIQTEWDRGTDRIFWMHLSMNISDADFDQGLDAVVAKAFDPWIKNASHDQIIEAIKTDTLIGSSAWHLSGHVSRAGGRPGWASVIVDVDDTSVDKEKAAREALKDYQRSIGRDAR